MNTGLKIIKDKYARRMPFEVACKVLDLCADKHNNCDGCPDLTECLTIWDTHYTEEE